MHVIKFFLLKIGRYIVDIAATSEEDISLFCKLGTICVIMSYLLTHHFLKIDIFQPTFWSTVWKLQNFFVTQTLCEINFGVSGSAKYAILSQLKALNFDLYDFLHFWKSENYQINKIQSPWNGKNGNFTTSTFSKIDLTENLNDRKILKFPHCVANSFWGVKKYPDCVGTLTRSYIPKGSFPSLLLLCVLLQISYYKDYTRAQGNECLAPVVQNHITW